MNERTKEVYYDCSVIHFEVHSHEFEVRVVILGGIIDPLPRFSWICFLLLFTVSMYTLLWWLLLPVANTYGSFTDCPCLLEPLLP